MRRHLRFNLTIILSIILYLTISMPAVAQNYTGAWFDPAQSGQGVTLLQQGNDLAGAWYLYDQSGNGMWVTFVGELTGDSANVELFRFSGPALGQPWNELQVLANSVGNASLTFSSPAAASFSYTLDGISGSLNLQPFTLGAGSAGPFSGTWWDPGKSGQAVTLLQEGDSLAGAWYFYDANGSGMWVTFVGNLAGDTANVDLLRFSGPALGSSWDETLVLSNIIGSAGFAFSAPDSAASIMS
jgi:hypothetical protein